MTGAQETVEDLTEDLLPAALACWDAHRARSPLPEPQAAWARPLAARRAIVEARLRAAIRVGQDGARARGVVAGDAVLAYLAGRFVRLPRGTPYRAYAPDRFLAVDADDWAATTTDAHGHARLAALYADLARWGLARGADAHQLAIPAGDDCTDLWLDLGFARHDRYAVLPIDEAGRLDAAVAGWTVRRVGPGPLDPRTGEALADFALGEARAHHRAPIFAFAPPGYETATRQGLAESMDDPDSFVVLAEQDGAPAGYLSGFLLPEVPFWAPAALPTPCAYLGSAYVAPAARARGGLRALVAATARLAAERGVRSLFTTYLPANLDAARAWQRLGFRSLLTIHQRRLDPRAVRQLRRMGVVLTDD